MTKPNEQKFGHFLAALPSILAVGDRTLQPFTHKLSPSAIL
jgi:hypothetical protein